MSHATKNRKPEPTASRPENLKGCFQLDGMIIFPDAKEGFSWSRCDYFGDPNRPDIDSHLLSGRAHVCDGKIGILPWSVRDALPSYWPTQASYVHDLASLPPWPGIRVERDGQPEQRTPIPPLKDRAEAERERLRNYFKPQAHRASLVLELAEGVTLRLSKVINSAQLASDLVSAANELLGSQGADGEPYDIAAVLDDIRNPGL